MKKKVISLTLAFLLLLGLSVPALADDVPDKSGFYVVDSVEGVTVTGADANKADIAAVSAILTNVSTSDTDVKTFYPGAVQLKVTLANTVSTQQYAVFLVEGAEAPTETSLKYIDQKGSGDSLTFYVYPAELGGNTELTLWITNSGGGDPVKIKLGYWAPYVLGVVDDDKFITTGDASYILQYLVDQVTLSESAKLAANVDGDTTITSGDSSFILQYIAATGYASFDEFRAARLQG